MASSSSIKSAICNLILVLVACTSASHGQGISDLNQNQVIFASDTGGKEICLGLREALEMSKTGSVRFTVQGQGSFVYNAPLADNNDTHPWHDLKLFSDPRSELSKRYKLLEFQIEGSRWKDSKGKIFDSIRTWLEKEQVNDKDRDLCIVVKFGPEDRPFADNKTFKEMNKLSEGRFIIVCE